MRDGHLHMYGKRRFEFLFLAAVVDAVQSIAKTHKCLKILAGCVFAQLVVALVITIISPLVFFCPWIAKETQQSVSVA